ncbi:MAG: hypothetical protein AB1898_23830 [Acidobacteriota bacterium]
MPCFLEVAVYDPHGMRLPFRITGVHPPKGNDTRINLLTDNRSEGRISARGDRLFFPESAIHRSLRIALSDGKAVLVTDEITLWSCQQRWSVQHGILETGFDTAWTLIKGRVGGCSITGDWWLRALPMFGAVSLTYEGYVSPRNGSFRIAVGNMGGRHILIIGKDRAPVKTLAVDVVGGGDNDVGLVDLSGSCPK